MVWFDRLKDFTALSHAAAHTGASQDGEDIPPSDGATSREETVLGLIESLTRSVCADRDDLVQGRIEGLIERQSQTQSVMHELEATLRSYVPEIRLWPEARKQSIEAAFQALAAEAEKTCRYLQALHTASQAISNHLLEAAEKQLSDGTYRRNGEKQVSNQLSLSQFSAKL